jgi:hypothetical protein
MVPSLSRALFLGHGGHHLCKRAYCGPTSTEIPAMPPSKIQLHRPSAPPANGLASHQPVTPDERRTDIERIAERIAGVVRSMCEMREMSSTSDEARDKGLAAFHERIAIAEKQLAHIHDRLRLE